MRQKFHNLIVSPSTTIREALRVIDEASHKTALVVDDEMRLLGVLSDGDVRRWILQNGPLDEAVERIMNRTPLAFPLNHDAALVKRTMETNMIEVIPVVDDEGFLRDVCLWRDLFGHQAIAKAQIQNAVVIMAGGTGSRLFPFTKILPKPLIPIGDKPIIEHIIDRFRDHGCSQFYLTVNYKADMIRSYFAEKQLDYSIDYMQEDFPLGTAGSLHLLRGRLDETFFVSNCDILIEGDYADMLRHHREHGSRLTMVASLKYHTVPYGVVHLNDAEQVASVSEKPELTWLVNTGLYILEPEALEDIPENSFFHITDLINRYLQDGVPVGVYPVSEGSWMDMGQSEEMREMIQKLRL